MKRTVLPNLTISCLLFAVFLMGLSFNTKPVKASGTIYIRPDGSIDPPDAPISTVDNVTYTLTGNITSDADGIVVERSNIIIDGAGFMVESAHAGTKGIDLSGMANVTIKNVNVKRFYDGICFYDSSNNTIIGNNITNNYYGIFLEASSNNVIFHNNFINNTKQVHDLSWSYPQLHPSINVWDNGFSSGGNYWSDYEERYPDATEINHSGIWDTPYVIDSNNIDHYPMIPEFPSPIILPLLTIATLLAVTVYTRKHII
jgi:parallel beta-helix repeat protein